MDLFVFPIEAAEIIDSELSFSPDDVVDLRRDLLALGAAELEVGLRLGADEFAETPHEALAVSVAAARLAVTSLYCDLFCAEPPGGVEPWRIAVYAGDIAKLELARQRFGLER